ncbi:hypothetical protein J6590_017365 [Homalodisca vitripennis]|nr:hypothetical protein J6590_017365 [Homalodisca vitripennis]
MKPHIEYRVSLDMIPKQIRTRGKFLLKLDNAGPCQPQPQRTAVQGRCYLCGRGRNKTSRKSCFKCNKWVMEEHNCCNLVFSSSCTVYGNPESLPITETHPTGNVTNVYGRTKYFIEEMLKDIIKADGHKWRIISLRYFNPVGAHQSGLIGEDPTKAFTNLMPYMAQVAIGKKPYLTIFGDDYDTIDGTGVRDYVHVMDLASGHVAAVQKLEADNHIGLQVFNLGIGEGLSVRQLVREFSRVTGQPVASVVQGRRVGDVDSLVCDGTRARAELSWTPTRDVTTMCEDFWRWQTMNPNGYRIESESKCNGSTSSNGIENKASMSNGIETNGH